MHLPKLYQSAVKLVAFDSATKANGSETSYDLMEAELYTHTFCRIMHGYTAKSLTFG